MPYAMWPLGHAYAHTGRSAEGLAMLSDSRERCRRWVPSRSIPLHERVSARRACSLDVSRMLRHTLSSRSSRARARRAGP